MGSAAERDEAENAVVFAEYDYDEDDDDSDDAFNNTQNQRATEREEEEEEAWQRSESRRRKKAKTTTSYYAERRELALRQLKEMEPKRPRRSLLYQRYQSHPPSLPRAGMPVRWGWTLEGHLALDEFQEEGPPTKKHEPANYEPGRFPERTTKPKKWNSSGSPTTQARSPQPPSEPHY